MVFQKDKMADDYRIRSTEGDFVRLPNGKTGVVVRTEFHCGGSSKEVIVRLDENRKKKHFYDGEIDELELICTGKELETIGDEPPSILQQG